MKLLAIFFGFLTLFQAELFSQFDTSINIEKPDKLVSLIENRFNSYETYSANFKEINSGRLKLGRVFYRKPNQIRINYFQGERVKTDIFYDGEKLYIYFVDQYIVFEEESPAANKASSGINPLYLIKNYNFNFLESSQTVNIFSEKEKKDFFLLDNNSSLRAYGLSLSPKNIELGLNKINLWVNEKGDVIRSKSTNILGQSTDQYYYDIIVNQKIEPEKFLLVIPNQVRIIKNFLKNN